jgi:phage head maturation protease
VQRGDVDGSSFAFGLDSDDDQKWDYAGTRNGQLPLRTIVRARLYDVSPVAYPAYDQTTVSARAQADARAEARQTRTFEADPDSRAREMRMAAVTK